MASNQYLKQLVGLKFDNLALKMLPVDRSMTPGSRKVAGACFSLVNPTPVSSPQLVAMSGNAMKLLDIDQSTAKEEELAEFFSGNKLLPGSETAAHCYCGHQFGSFSGQLGDGAAIYLGEVINHKNERWEIQIKGAGPTPYSRSSDGRKVLRSSIREFLCSEAMHHLGIPSTRAGTVTTSDSTIVRDMFYDGRPRMEKCTVVLRIAPTFLRFGSFEIFKSEDDLTFRSGPSVGREDILIQLLDYTISNFYPHIREQHPDAKVDRYLKFYEEVCIRTAELVALWQCCGFCHGVLNTDNMSILGLTIDYGPFGFLDRYDPNFICNSSDDSGRYNYRQQPLVCYWNLKMFAEALQLCVPLEKSLEVRENVYYSHFNASYLAKMRKKLGLITQQVAEDEKLVKDLLNTLEVTNADFTNALRSLSHLSLPGLPGHDESYRNQLNALLDCCADLEMAKKIMKPGIPMDQIRKLRSMLDYDPMFLSLVGGMEGPGPIKREMEKAVKYEKMASYTEESLRALNEEKWKIWLDQYKARLEKECESHPHVNELEKERKKVMNANNPKYILRNYIAQNAIEEAEKGNFLEVRNILRRLEKPYDDDVDAAAPPLFGFNNIPYGALPPSSAMDLRVS